MESARDIESELLVPLVEIPVRRDDSLAGLTEVLQNIETAAGSENADDGPVLTAA